MSLKRFLEESSRLIKIKSVSYLGNEELANYIEGWMQSRGFFTKLQQVTHSLSEFSKRQHNVIGVLGDQLVDQKIKTGLLLINHIDTAGVNDHEEWVTPNGDPFSMSVKEDFVFGLGSVSGKLDFLCKMVAAQKFRNRKLKMPLYLVAVCGGAHSFFGTHFLLQSLSLNPKHVLVGTPTHLKLGTSGSGLWLGKLAFRYPVVEKGSRGFNRKVEIKSRGVSAHPSFIEEGRNAIDQLLDFLNLCFESGFEMKFTSINGGEASPGVPTDAQATVYLTSHQLEDFKRFFQNCLKSEDFASRFKMNLGGIGETGLSFLPQEIFECLLEYRREIEELQSTLGIKSLMAYHLEQSSGKIEWHLVGTIPQGKDSKAMQDGLSDLAKRFSKENPHISARVEVTKKIKPFDLSKNSEWISKVKEAMKTSGIEPVSESFSYYSQAGMFDEAQFEALMFGGGESKSNWNQKNERIQTQEIEKSIAFYENLIEQVCL